MGKGLTEARSPQRQLVPDNVGPGSHEPTFLRGIAIKAETNKEHRFRDLYRCLNADLLRYCWRDLNKDAASGVDQVTAEQYAKDLEANLEALAERLKRKKYHAKLVRRVYIPKENGKERPLGIPALEDKLVQLACAKLLAAIFEQDFLDCSYGYRPGKGARQAVNDLTRNLQFGVYGYVVEADIKGFFDHMDHDWLLEMLAERVDDRAFLNLIRKWLKAGVLETDGQVVHPQHGTPQGGIISPILANVYLHYVLDLWFEKVVKPQVKGEAMLCRYADDWVCAFRFKEDADRFYKVIPERLKQYGLQVAPEKTRCLRFSRFHPSMKRRFTFLGFEIYWHYNQKGKPWVQKRTARKKLQASKRRFKVWIRKARHMSGRAFFRGLNARLRGHYNYYGLPGNTRSLWSVYYWAIQCTFKWLNRRGGKRNSYDWETFKGLLKRLGIAKPCTVPVRP